MKDLMLHMSMWIGCVGLGYGLAGGGPPKLPDVTYEEPPAVVVTEIIDEDKAYERCGKYDLGYYQAQSGFYNCVNRNRQGTATGIQWTQ